MTNARVVKEAWAAFAVWCVIALVACWWLAGQVYENRLGDATSQIAALKTRLEIVASERDELKNRLGEKSARPPSDLQRDPDALYQFGELVAQAPSGNIDRPNGKISFHTIVGNSNFSIHRDMDYRQYVLSGCQYSAEGRTGSMDITLTFAYADVTCQLSGLRP